MKKFHHELKKLFQWCSVPPWERDRVPLLFWGETLIAVLGYWWSEKVGFATDDCAIHLDGTPLFSEPSPL